MALPKLDERSDLRKVPHGLAARSTKSDGSPQRRSYELSNLHPSHRSKPRKTLGGKERYRTSRPGAFMKVHRLRVRAAGRLPSTATGVLSAVPHNSSSDPFESARHWSNSTLPSFKSLGAISKGAFGGVVIYSDETFKRFMHATR